MRIKWKGNVIKIGTNNEKDRQRKKNQEPKTTTNVINEIITMTRIKSKSRQ